MIELAAVEEWLDRLYVAAEGAALRQEERRKAREIAAMLDEIERAATRFSQQSSMVLVDAAAGKSYIGLLSAKLVFDPAGRHARVITIERESARVQASLRAAQRLETRTAVECVEADISSAEAWPRQISIVAALHACGPAADTVIERAIEARARCLLLVPCCTSAGMPAVERAAKRAQAIGIPRHAHVRRRFIQSIVDAERTLRLETAGYETEVVEFVSPSVTPQNLLWRARLVGEEHRMNAAHQALTTLHQTGTRY